MANAKTVFGKAEDEVKAVEKEISAEAKALFDKVESWFAKHFHGNKISGDTESYNLAYAAKEDLKKILSPKE